MKRVPPIDPDAMRRGPEALLPKRPTNGAVRGGFLEGENRELRHRRGVAAKPVYRSWREGSLALRGERPRWRKMVANRKVRLKRKRINEPRSLDFVHHQLGKGRVFRALIVVGEISCKALVIKVGTKAVPGRLFSIFCRANLCEKQY